MALLSQMMRTVAITGRTDTYHAWFADRQGGRWADQTVAAAFPRQAAHTAATPRPTGMRAAAAGPLDPTAAARDLAALHARGVVTDAEYERLRARI
jgi:hypothetical protein